MPSYATLTPQITTEDIDHLCESLQVGDVIPWEIKLMDDETGRLLIPVRIKYRVVKKYPHIVEVERISGPRNHGVETLRYAEIAARRKGEER